MSTSTSQAVTSIGPVRRVVDGVGPRERAGACARARRSRRTSGAVPTEFAATGNATTRVRSDELRLEVGVVELELVASGRRRARRCRDRGRARATGETFASWSSAVTTISSPSRSVRPNARVSRKFSAVMLWPKAVSPGEQPRNDAARSCASVDELVGADARLVRCADVRVVLAQVARDRVDDLVRALRPARPVEERESAIERREARADRGDVERGGAHKTSWPLTIQRCRGFAVSEFDTKQPCSALRDELAERRRLGCRSERRPRASSRSSTNA